MRNIIKLFSPCLNLLIFVLIQYVFQGGSVNLSSSLYPFFCWSQLKDESKGGYLTGTIKVPERTKKIELSLSTKFGLPHPNLLFVTPSIKQSGEKPLMSKSFLI